MAFSKQQLQKFANLIRLDLNDEQLEQMNLDSIVGWLDKLQQINTDGVTPMLTPADHEFPTREDVVTSPNIRENLLKNAPDTTGNARGYFAVPKVIDEE